MKFNREKLDEIGFNFDSDRDAMIYISSLIDYIATHNKNYTNAQYHRILTLKDIMDCVEDD